MMDIELRSLAKEIGISAATLMRIEHGYIPDGETMAKVLAWQFLPMPEDLKRVNPRRREPVIPVIEKDGGK